MRTLLQLLLAGVLLIALSEIQTQIQLGLGLSLANGVETSQQNPQLGTRGGLSPRLGFAAASDTLAQELDTDAEAMGYSGGVVEEPMDEAYAYEESQTQEALPEKEETGSRTGSAAQPVSPFTAMFGETLYRWGDSPNKEEIHEYYTHELLAGQRTIGVYFSASWCAPCRQFTPVLAKFYEEMNKKGKKFEIVWVSRDNSADEFVAYYQKMPWLAVPIQNVQKCLEAVADKFRVKGIPHLVILDGYDATVYTLDGRGAVAKDPYGLEFPWEPKTLMSVLPRPVRNMIKAQIDTFKSSIRKALSGILQSIMPPSVLKSLGMTA